MTALAAFSGEEFARRREAQRTKLAERKCTRAEAESAARVWLAIAARFGADLPELYEDTQDYSKRPPVDLRARFYAHELATREEMRTTLANARDTALDLGRSCDRTMGLCRMAIALGCPAYVDKGLVQMEQAA